MVRRILWGTLALTPVVLVARYGFHLGATPLFLLSAAALIPLAWLIGEATEHAAEHTGPGIGGFLNASFGNAPELIIALFAVADGLPRVVRGTITGSVVSNILLVLGAAMIFGGEGRLDARSLRWQLAGVAGGVVLFLIPSIPGWSGSPNRHALLIVTIPLAIVLLVAYGVITVKNLRIHSGAAREAPQQGAWSLAAALATLGGATLATAFVSEVLVHSLHSFGKSVGLGEFFIAVVIVALVGNAAEHGGAIVIASRGNTQLATEIAITSSMQVALFVAPAVALVSLLFSHRLTLAFRPVEVATMMLAAVLAWLVTRDGRSNRREGFLLATAYGVAVVAYALFP
ncbi:MAG TPA: calcium/proton exchanger [Gaiellaceae bacterium]|nr:calcium/proton exchanger [Gaiellaceae bacterium]